MQADAYLQTVVATELVGEVERLIQQSSSNHRPSYWRFARAASAEVSVPRNTRHRRVCSRPYLSRSRRFGHVVLNRARGMGAWKNRTDIPPAPPGILRPGARRRAGNAANIGGIAAHAGLPGGRVRRSGPLPARSRLPPWHAAPDLRADAGIAARTGRNHPGRTPPAGRADQAPAVH